MGQGLRARLRAQRAAGADEAQRVREADELEQVAVDAVQAAVAVAPVLGAGVLVAAQVLRTLAVRQCHCAPQPHILGYRARE